MRELYQRMSAVTMELNLKFMRTIQMTVCQLLCHFLTLQDQLIGFLTLFWKIRTGNLFSNFSCMFLIPNNFFQFELKLFYFLRSEKSPATS